ncbi:HipA N-terminal domain-containing protein [Ningiella sp. W23]|uniref:HipA N-terminal domain-containing protein n=1 Tax=Ningiella sp. W23 TaxID=3023715 RepID=UPI00375731D6
MLGKLCVNVMGYDSGQLFEENNHTIFRYSDNVTCEHFVSLTMPVRKQEYSHSKLLPIFEMHLPEGYLLSVIKKHFAKITRTDDLGLLHILSTSVDGRISYSGNIQESEPELSKKHAQLAFDECVEAFEKGL